MPTQYIFHHKDALSWLMLFIKLDPIIFAIQRKKKRLVKYVQVLNQRNPRFILERIIKRYEVWESQQHQARWMALDGPPPSLSMSSSCIWTLAASLDVLQLLMSCVQPRPAPSNAVSSWRSILETRKQS